MSSPVRGERLSREDARILELESARVAGHTLKVLVLQDRPGAARLDAGVLRAHVAARLHRAPRLRQRLEPSATPVSAPAWVEDTSFDIERHIRPGPAEPAAPAALRALIGQIMSDRLDRTRPLWTLDVVHGPGTETTLVLKLHHAMADGTGAVRIASAVLWDAAAAGQEARTAMAASSPARGLARRWRWPELLRETRRLPMAVTRELAPHATRSAFARRVGRRRAVAFAAFPLSDARAIKDAIGSGITVNDVVLCAVASGLRHWFDAHRGEPPRLRVKVPVSLHGHDESDVSVGNRDSFFFIDLPLLEPDPVRRLLDISDQSRRCKRLGDAQALDVFFRDVDRVSRILGRAAARWSMSRRVFTTNVSNVPGPAGRLDVCGRPVVAVYSVAEVADWHAMRISAFSAVGVLTFGICTDPDVVGGVEAIAEGIEGGLAELRSRAAEPRPA